jgi:hypothetical protein
MRALEEGGLSTYDEHQLPPPQDAKLAGQPFLGYWCKVGALCLLYLCVGVCYRYIYICKACFVMNCSKRPWTYFGILCKVGALCLLCLCVGVWYFLSWFPVPTNAMDLLLWGCNMLLWAFAKWVQPVCSVYRGGVLVVFMVRLTHLALHCEMC